MSNVEEKIKTGKIGPEALSTDERGRLWIDSDIADKHLKERTDMSRANGYRARMESLKKKPDPDGEPALEALPDKLQRTIVPKGELVKTIPPDDTSDNFNRYQRAKATTEEERAKKLQLERAELEGRLLDAEEVRKEIVKLVSETKEKVLNVAGKIAPEVMGLKDIVEVETKIHSELVNALDSLSRFSDENNEGK